MMKDFLPYCRPEMVIFGRLVMQVYQESICLKLCIEILHE